MPYILFPTFSYMFLVFFTLFFTVACMLLCSRAFAYIFPYGSPAFRDTLYDFLRIATSYVIIQVPCVLLCIPIVVYEFLQHITASQLFFSFLINSYSSLWFESVIACSHMTLLRINCFQMFLYYFWLFPVGFLCSPYGLLHRRIFSSYISDVLLFFPIIFLHSPMHSHMLLL